MTETAIADHGLIGDLQTAALVTTDGSIDWFCCPRFDSPSVFGALLDDERGGHFRVRPVGEPFTSTQMYHPDTAILITRFMSASGVCEVHDFMPVTGLEVTGNHRLVRMLRCVRGRMAMEFDILPRFDYGRSPYGTRVLDGGVVFETDEMSLTVHVVREPDDERLGHAEVDQGRVRASLTLTAGQVRGVVLESAAAGPPREIRVAEFQQMFDDTVAFWRAWLAQSTYTGRWREILQRSAITLKLMTYAPTGGLVAAPTAGLPEQVGGERNWDYRYTWVRDASFSVYALLGMGFTEEAAQFCVWLRDRVVERRGATGNPLNIMYSVDGTADLPEVELEGWSGYRGSLPIRIGNAAAEQLQLDIYGEALDSIYFADAHGLEIGHAGWTALVTLLDWLTDNWDQPDDGIWESRGGRQDFTYGRLMCWVAFDRAIRLATSRARPASLERWTAARDGIYEQIMARGWNEEKQAFVQHYASDVLDSALLRMGTVGFLSPYDPMWQSTLRAMDEELVTDGLVYRYDPSASPDGLQGSEGTFSLCSFTYVDALARAGRVDEARLAFEKILTYANHVGLFSEEIALTGEQIGNFPQAFTHLSLIDAALTLDRALDRRGAPAQPRSGPRPTRRPPAPRVSPEADGAPAPVLAGTASATGRTGNGRRDGGST
jgi:GH15 family glucan-1,4-alpha-glucosidase